MQHHEQKHKSHSIPGAGAGSSIIFTRRGAWLGLIAYIVLILIIALFL